jgi:NTP pyrophosphatase (non-canonical NTP hydrolase)
MRPGFQQEVGDIMNRKNFTKVTLEHRALILGEEVGEFQRAILKQSQGIRGTTEFWHEEQCKELAEIVIACYAAADFLGIDLEDWVSKRWDQVKIRDWVADPLNGGDNHAALPA